MRTEAECQANLAEQEKGAAKKSHKKPVLFNEVADWDQWYARCRDAEQRLLGAMFEHFREEGSGAIVKQKNGRYAMVGDDFSFREVFIAMVDLLAYFTLKDKYGSPERTIWLLTQRLQDCVYKDPLTRELLQKTFRKLMPQTRRAGKH